MLKLWEGQKFLGNGTSGSIKLDNQLFLSPFPKEVPLNRNIYVCMFLLDIPTDIHIQQPKLHLEVGVLSKITQE